MYVYIYACTSTQAYIQTFVPIQNLFPQNNAFICRQYLKNKDSVRQ